MVTALLKMHSLGFFFSYLRLAVSQDSLAAEIEGTMRKELSLDDPECEEQKYVRMLHWIRFTHQMFHMSSLCVDKKNYALLN